MLVVNTREFRQNQKTYLDKIDSGQNLLLLRGINKSYRILPATMDDTLISKKHLLSKIHCAEQEYAEGKSYIYTTWDDFEKHIDCYEV
jgi:hypothetical protein